MTVIDSKGAKLAHDLMQKVHDENVAREHEKAAKKAQAEERRKKAAAARKTAQPDRSKADTTAASAKVARKRSGVKVTHQKPQPRKQDVPVTAN